MMLPAPFSFGGRIARWSYFKGCLALAVFCLVPTFLAVTAYGQHRAGTVAGLVGSLLLLGLCAIVVIWVSLTLQARRCRDIGWPPGYMIPAWIAMQFLDPVLAQAAPAIVAGEDGSGTVLGAAFNIVWFLALTFWPSADAEILSHPSAPAALLRPRPEPVGAPFTAAEPRRAPASAMPARTTFGLR